MKTYYERLKDLREDKDMTQSDIAEILGIFPQQYSRYEKGQRELPLHHLVTLCEHFKVSADYILGIRF